MKPSAASVGRWLALSLPLATLIVSALCFANGGPVGSTTATGRGNGAPKRRSSIRLVSEKLSLKLDADGMHYDALAEYLLSNPGPTTEVLYGVPFRLGDESEGPLPKVTVKVAEQSYDCRFGRRRKPPVYSEEEAERESAKVLPPEDEMLRGPDTWCTTRISVPTGERIPLSLSYRAELVYDDESFSKTFFTDYSDRWLVYSFAPAGGWQGPADELSITLDLGPFAGFETISGLRGFRREGSHLLWSQNQVDLSRLGPLKVKLDVSPVLHPRDLLKWRRKTKMRFAARELGHIPALSTGDAGAAASTSGQTEVTQATDGDSATAWCAGGDVAGRSFEVSWKPPRARDEEEDVTNCQLEAFAVFPGDLSSQQAYEQKRKVSRVRFAACGGPADTGQGKATKLTLAMKPRFSALASMYLFRWRSPEGSTESFTKAYRAEWDGLVDKIRGREESNAAAGVTPKKNRGQVDKARDCVRVIILDAEGDPAQPACLSEIMPVFNCG
jgi:hypothetical protein